MKATDKGLREWVNLSKKQKIEQLDVEVEVKKAYAMVKEWKGRGQPTPDKGADGRYALRAARKLVPAYVSSPCCMHDSLSLTCFTPCRRPTPPIGVMPTPIGVMPTQMILRYHLFIVPILSGCSIFSYVSNLFSHSHKDDESDDVSVLQFFIDVKNVTDPGTMVGLQDEDEDEDEDDDVGGGGGGGGGSSHGAGSRVRNSYCSHGSQIPLSSQCFPFRRQRATPPRRGRCRRGQTTRLVPTHFVS
jgi:hypothetical protein